MSAHRAGAAAVHGIAMKMTMTSRGKPLYIVVLAGGCSSRMGAGVKKQYLPLGEGSVLSASVRAIMDGVKASSTTQMGDEGRRTPCILVITYPSLEDERGAYDALYADKRMADLLSTMKVLFVQGGSTRQESVYNALTALKTSCGDCADGVYVMIHDAARPFVPPMTVSRVLNAALNSGAATAGVPVTDSIVTTNGEHLKRENLMALQTPQCFQFRELLTAHEKAISEGAFYTDDSSLYDAYHDKGTTMVEGDISNKKITYAADIPAAHKVLPPVVGLGYDSHRLVTGRALMLAGVRIDSDRGEAGHSDGDALLHALIDSLLGAAGMGDIGEMFPTNDNRWHNASSLDMLRLAWGRLKESGYMLVNTSLVVKIESPRISPYRERMITSIANAMQVDKGCIALSAKTGEGLDSVGRGEGVEAWAVSSLQK